MTGNGGSGDKLLTQLVEKLKAAFGDRLVSVVLYGSAVTGDHQPMFSDYNVLCVLSEIARRELAASEPIFRWWREQGSPAPLLLTRAGSRRPAPTVLRSSFTTSCETTGCCTGRTSSPGWLIDDCFYRAQVEHDLRAKLLRLAAEGFGDAVRRGPAAAADARFDLDVLRAVPARADPPRRGAPCRRSAT